MKRPLIITLFIILTALLIVGVLVLAVGSKDIYEKTFSLWYFYSTIGLFLSWLVAMYGLWFMKPWAALLCVLTTMVHHLTLLIVGAWSISQLPLLLVPIIIVGWVFRNQLIKIRKSDDI